MKSIPAKESRARKAFNCCFSASQPRPSLAPKARNIVIAMGEGDKRKKYNKKLYLQILEFFMQGTPQNKTIPDTGKGVWQSPRVKSQNISCFFMRWQQIELGMKRNVLKNKSLDTNLRKERVSSC